MTDRSEFTSGTAVTVGFDPLGPRAYELAEERQRRKEHEAAGDCSLCSVHPIFREKQCVHCWCHNNGGQSR